MTLNLNLNIDKAAGRGRAPVPVDHSVVREIEEADLELLASSSRGVVAPDLQRITARHHTLARLLMSGTPEGEAALIAGYDVSRVSILKKDPTFQQLMNLYAKEVQDKFASNLDQMAGLSMDALAELRSRIEKSPEDFTARELMTIVTDIGDRASAGEENTSLPQKIEIAFVSPEDDDSDA